jgi:hypothetical protein
VKTISKIEQDVNQIRLNIYENTKDMTPAQLSEYYRQSTEGTIKKYGFRVVASARNGDTQGAQGR